MRWRSIRVRLALWYAGVLACALALFGVSIWWSLRSRLISEIDRELNGRAGRFEQYFRAESAEYSGGHLRGELVEFSQALPPSSFVSLQGSRGFTFTYPAGARAEDVRIARRQFELNGETFLLETGEPVTDVRHTLDLLRLLLIGLIPAVIVVASAGGIWLSRRALKPVADVTEAAHSISIENLSARLPVPQTGDEIARLVDVLNRMLARLESAVKTLSDFAADASHELRTPLAVIRTTAELALRKARSPDAYRDSLREIADETARMTRLVEDLLLLARTGTGAVEMPRSTLDLREIVNDVCAEMRGLAELRKIRVAAKLPAIPATISGNRAGLHRLLVALVDNAIKFSRDGGEVEIGVETDASHISVFVEDFGAGIPAADLPNIFRRFYRADPPRAGEGYGIGLALAESIARAHQAEIKVQSEVGRGSRFSARFARRAPSSIAPAFSESSA